jgi:hypothetical protein
MRLTPRQDADCAQWLMGQLHNTAPASEGPYLPTEQAPVPFPEDACRRIIHDWRVEEDERRAYQARRRELRGYRSPTRRTEDSHRPSTRRPTDGGRGMVGWTDEELARIEAADRDEPLTAQEERVVRGLLVDTQVSPGEFLADWARWRRSCLRLAKVCFALAGVVGGVWWLLGGRG